MRRGLLAHEEPVRPRLHQPVLHPRRIAHQEQVPVPLEHTDVRRPRAERPVVPAVLMPFTAGGGAPPDSDSLAPLGHGPRSETSADPTTVARVRRPPQART